MKITKFTFYLFCTCLVMVLVNGCGKKDVGYQNTSGSMKPEGYSVDSTGTAGSQEEGLSTGELEPLDQTGVNPLDPDTSSEEYRSVYGRSTAPLYPVFFDFDSSALKPDQLDNLNSSGTYLLENNTPRLVIEGNCDERGTTDYNLALGELRAINVKKYLVNLGMATERITTISYGSQRPLYPGSDEESWAMNRRADLVIP